MFWPFNVTQRRQRRLLDALGDREMDTYELGIATGIGPGRYRALKKLELDGVLVSRWGEPTVETEGHRTLVYRRRLSPAVSVASSDANLTVGFLFLAVVLTIPLAAGLIASIVYIVDYLP